MSHSDGHSKTRRIVRNLLVVTWLAVFASQLVLYTSIAEIVGYALLGIVIAVAYLRWVSRPHAPFVLFGAILVAALLLGLVPYKIRLNDWALFFFESAKAPGVTYSVDPYLNLRAIVWDALFPAAHLALMYAIAWTYRPQASSGLRAASL